MQLVFSGVLKCCKIHRSATRIVSLTSPRSLFAESKTKTVAKNEIEFNTLTFLFQHSILAEQLAAGISRLKVVVSEETLEASNPFNLW